MGWLTGLPLKMYAYAGIALLVVGLGLAVKVQSARLASAKAETVKVQASFDLFKEEARQIGEAQNAKAKAADAANQQLKEKADAQSAKSKADLAAMYAKYRGLLNSKPGSHSGQLPPAPAVTSSTPRTCFSTAGFAHAMGIIEAGVPNIIEQGDGARERLNNAVNWAKGQTP